MQTETSHCRAFGIPFTALTQARLAEEFAGTPPEGSCARLIVTANVDHIVQLRRNAKLRRAYANAWHRTIDGAPVFLYARLRGAAPPERVTGADLFQEVLPMLQPGKHRPFFVCGDQRIADFYAEWCTKVGFSDGKSCVGVPPFGFEHDAEASAALASAIAGNRTTHLFMGVGCPKSEVWVDERKADLGDLHAMAVGAALGFFAGQLRRAPEFMQEAGLEWIWRVGQEPRRLLKRYVLASWPFWGAIWGDLRGRAILSSQKAETGESHPVPAGEASRKVPAVDAPRKVLAVASSGGHWEQLMLLQPAFEGCQVIYCSTGEGPPSAKTAIEVLYLPDSSRSSVRSALRTLSAARSLVRSTRPDVIVTTGAMPGLICLFWGKLFGAKAIWIDSLANFERLSLSGRVAGLFADDIVVQWQHLARGKVRFYGSIL